MTEMPDKGRYIVIEGNDGTGKSTQVELLAEYFRKNGRDVQIIEEPGSDDTTKSTLVASELRRIIKNGNLQRDPEINLALFSAARREQWLHIIQPALNKGSVVLSARNYLSTLAYQGYGEGLDEQEIMRMTRLFTSDRYMNPDHMIVLSLNHHERARRIAQRGKLHDGPDTFESRPTRFQDAVNQAYIDIANKFYLPTIDASQSITQIHAQIIHLLRIDRTT